MNRFNYNKTTSYSSYSSKTYYDKDLREYFLKIYTIMSSALLITGVFAFSVFSIPALSNVIFNIAPGGYLVGMTGIGWIISLAPLAIALYFNFGFDKINAQNAQILFWVYSSLMGISLSALGFIYTGTSITKTLFICAAMFASMSIYGYTTKKDLTSVGSFLYMGLIGLLIASVTNIFIKSSAIEFAQSVVGVLVFIGLVAYDTQKLKALYYYNEGESDKSKICIMAAFTLYLDFINLFIFMLKFIGIRKEND